MLNTLISKLKEPVPRDVLLRVQNAVRVLYQPPSVLLHSIYSKNQGIFSEDWDLLIVLDTCRVDAMISVADEYEFIDEVDTRWSVGAHSMEWMLNTFCDEFATEISDTAHITSNPYALKVIENQPDIASELESMNERVNRYNLNTGVDPGDFHTYISLYDQSTEYSERAYPNPRKVTDHAIDISRTSQPDRMVVHYMPPHKPYLAHQDDDGIHIGESRPNTSFDAYLDNLRWGLNEVEVLLQNIDRNKVVITADHGQSFWLRSVRRGHRPGMVAPTVRRVPWVVTTAEDTGQRQPDLTQSETSDLENTLEALGYL